MSRILFILFFIVSSFCVAQREVSTSSIAIDEKYREDQFYVNFTYNAVFGIPDSFRSRGLTGGFSFGYLRDMPLNKTRNIAIALGAGLSIDQYGHNLFIGETNANESIFTVLRGNVSFDNNRFSTATIEIPLELRWRTSTAEKYKFWRIYSGVRVGYTYWYKATFSQATNEVIQTDIDEFDPVRVAATFTFGYDKINFFAAYSVNPFFKDTTTIQNEEITFQPLKLGFIFYIL